MPRLDHIMSDKNIGLLSLYEAVDNMMLLRGYVADTCQIDLLNTHYQRRYINGHGDRVHIAITNEEVRAIENIALRIEHVFHNKQYYKKVNNNVP